MKLLLTIVPSILGCWWQTPPDILESTAALKSTAPPIITTTWTSHSTSTTVDPTDIVDKVCQNQEDCGNGWMCRFDYEGQGSAIPRFFQIIFEVLKTNV